MEVRNEPGSAGISEGHEVSTTIYIAVSEYDEYPAQNLFKLSPVYNPILVSRTNDDSKPQVTIEYGPSDLRKSITIKISLNQLEIN